MLPRFIGPKLVVACVICAALAATETQPRVASHGDRPNVRANLEALPAPESAEAPVDIQVDPDLPVLSDEEIAAIKAETEGHGFLILQDGDVLRGRVLAEGMLILPGARVYYEGAIQIVSSDKFNYLLGTLVPLPRELDATHRAGAQAGDGGIASGCTSFTDLVGDDGNSPDNVDFMMAGDATIDSSMFQNLDGGPAPEVNVTGTPDAPNVQAIGGTGGKGADVTIVVNGRLTINGSLSNAKGGRGAVVFAYGLPGSACGACGGKAFAYGGNGGQAGKLEITAQSLTWNPPPPDPLFGTHNPQRLSIKAGGPGGTATATGGAGGNCAPDICGDGGEGGNATAGGGTGGASNSITIRVTGSMTPSPIFFARRAVGTEAGAEGGTAFAVGGQGGSGGQCTCPQSGGSGASAGYATAIGGIGGAGIGAAGDVVLIKELGFLTLRYPLPSSNGGQGGHADSQGERGGYGANANPCACDLNGPAGGGGNGGDGGDACSTGGKGGPAKSSFGVTVFSGNGGNATFKCAQVDNPPGPNSGKPGDGGSCLGNQPPTCTPGSGGLAGSAATASGIGGEPGDALSGANRGSHGLPLTDSSYTCFSFPDGQPGVQECPKGTPCGDPTTGGCCVPHETPGCDNAKCCTTVCDFEPFCCADTWDELCAFLASAFCADCTPPSD
jgi:hypothetical protein